MTRGWSVKERSKTKRVNDLEVAIERCKVVSKVLTVLDALKKEEEHVTPLKRLEILRPQLGLAKPHKVAHFVHRSPQLFEVCRDSRDVMWAGLSPQAEALIEEEARLLEEHSSTAAEKRKDRLGARGALRPAGAGDQGSGGEAVVVVFVARASGEP